MSGLLSRLLRRLRGGRGKTTGVRRLVWVISPPTRSQLPVFLRSLPALMPAGSVLYLEGKPAPEVQRYLEGRASDGVSSAGWDEYGDFVARVALTADNLNGLAELAERLPSHDITFYLHVLHGSEYLLEWWDVPDNSIFMPRGSPKALVKALCSPVGLKCRKMRIWHPA
ncbi:MAG: hypothetical protein ACE149_18830 [Armatimonadota bacterium]